MTTHAPNLELLKSRHKPARTAALPADLPLPVMAQEGEPALSVAPRARPKRPYRLETTLTAEAGQRLTSIQARLSVRKGRRQNVNEVIEQAIALFDQQLGA